MNIQKILFSTIAAGIAMFILAGLWHSALMSDLYMGEGSRAEPSMGLIAGGYLVLALLMAYIYPKGIEGDNKIANGIKFGMIVGLIWVLPHSLILYAVMEGFSLKVIMIDSIWHLVEQGVGGIIIAMIYGLPKAEAASSEE